MIAIQNVLKRLARGDKYRFPTFRCQQIHEKFFEDEQHKRHVYKVQRVAIRHQKLRSRHPISSLRKL